MPTCKLALLTALSSESSAAAAAIFAARAALSASRGFVGSFAGGGGGVGRDEIRGKSAAGFNGSLRVVVPGRRDGGARRGTYFQEYFVLAYGTAYR